MKNWDDLTQAGQIRRLRPLAMAALDSYSVTPRRLSLVGGFTNVIFRVDTNEGPLALRVDLHQEHSDQDIDVELAWLAAISRDTDLDICGFIPARDGRHSVYAAAPGVPGQRRCVLFRWVPGKPLADNLSETGYMRLGQLSAGLHIHGQSFVPPHQPLVWDRVFYWPEEVDPVVIFNPRLAHHIDSKRRTTLDAAITATTAAFARLDPQAAQMTHGDLHPWNVHSYRSRLIAFDFEDVTWAHPVQDVATTLFYERTDPQYAALRKAFETGYRSVAPWPVTYEGELEHFMAARTLMLINFVANLRDDPSDFYETAFPRLDRFLADWVE
ncbi:MAG: phosphotransferase [bacterium]|nr:phosphotransferase [bacterium]